MPSPLTTSARLTLAAALALGLADVAAAGTTTTLTLDAPDTILLGTSGTLTVRGARAGETVYLVRSYAGLGAGPCSPKLGGKCLSLRSPVTQLKSAVASSIGEVVRVVTPPDKDDLEGVLSCWQAYVVRGSGGVNTVLSAPACALLDRDTDLDGVLDAEDVCPGVADDAFDWDLDGVPDVCDDVAAPVYGDVGYATPPTVWTFQGREVRSYLPADPVGVVWVFHGTNGGPDVVDLPEMTVVLNELVDRGYGFVAVKSAGTKFDHVNGPAANKDWSYVDALRQRLISDGRFSRSTPTFALGFSAGGAFTSWVGNVAPSRGWPLKALVLHNSAGWTSWFRNDLPDLPIAFVPSENDSVVLASDVETAYDRQLAAGFDAVLLLNREQRLAPTRFDRSPYIDHDGSLDVFDQLVAHGWYDAQGRRVYAGDPDALVDVEVEQSDVSPRKPTKAVLSSVLALHAVHGGHAVEEADFVDAHR